MQDLERLNHQLGFEDWAKPNGYDLTSAEAGVGYVDPITCAAWEGYVASQSPRHEGQQLYAEIKKSSKYASQIALCRAGPCGYPFKVCIVEDLGGYVVIGGAGGRYRLADVNLYVMHEGKKIPLQ